MYRLLIAAPPTSWHFRDLVRAAASRQDLEIVSGDLTRLCGSVSDPDKLVGTRLAISDMPMFPWRTDAVLVRALPVGSLQQVVLRMDLLSAWERQGVLVINPAKTMEAAVDKFLTLNILAAASLPVPLTIACQHAWQASAAWSHFKDAVVIKPLFGSEGRGLRLCRDRNSAAAVWEHCEQSQQVILMQQYIDHPGWDLRLLVIGQEIFGMKRTGQNDWRNNASLGARVEAYKPTATEADMARRAASALGAVIAGVDLIYDQEHQPYLLEVNGAPGWRYLSMATGVDVAQQVLNLVIEKLAGREPVSASRVAAD